MKYPLPMRRRRRLVGALALSAAAALVLSACGGGDTGAPAKPAAVNLPVVAAKRSPSP